MARAAQRAVNRAAPVAADYAPGLGVGLRAAD
jgi:hypothetical protein